MTNSEFTTTDISRINSDFNRLFDGLQDPNAEAGVSFARSASTNFIIPVMAAELDQAHKAVDLLVRFRPSRFFLVVVDSTATKFDVAISARCELFSKTQHVCSEIVQIRLAPALFKALPAVLQENFLTGRSIEAFVVDSAVPQDLLLAISSLCDEVVYDSANFGKHNLLEQLMMVRASFVDLEWLGLSPWRAAVRSAFDYGQAPLSLAELANVELRAAPAKVAGSKSIGGFSILLLTGWIINRLGLEISSYGRNGFDCVSDRGQKVVISPPFELARTEFYLSEIDFTFKPTTQKSDKLSAVAIKFHTGMIETEVRRETSLVKSSVPVESGDLASMLERYYLIGESISNYKESLKIALELEAVRKAFSG